MRVFKACDEFLLHCRSEKKLSPHTQRAYEIDLQEFQHFVGPGRSFKAVDKHRLRAYRHYLSEEKALKEASA